ncbi:hypothetical protein [Gluconobacter wancherniae]|nr:hypothetical protein [Gluconobacter wancherniae]GBD56566.1 hypothetical protein NBRC103581_01145 [Gluconobacter wancherniae NBRC 103581]
MHASECRSLHRISRRLVETCSMGAWLMLAATPIIVVFCAIHG